MLALACATTLMLTAVAQASGGSLMAWGDNYSGQFGNGTTGEEANPNPTPVSGISTAVEVAGGEEDGLALMADGTVMTWGGNHQGGLGNGSSVAESTIPIPVPGIHNAVAVAAGFEHSLALLADGTVMAWGTNFNGQLGTGDAATGPDFCNKISTCSRSPVLIPGLANVIAISAAQRHSYALLADGTVMAWGEDTAGEQGDGVGHRDEGCGCVDHPVPVPGVGGGMSIAAGIYDGKVVHANGSVSAWGYNSFGALGLGTTERHGECSCLPATAVPGLAGVLAVAPGGDFTHALRSDGLALAWGANFSGQLGLGFTSEESETCSCVPTPTLVPGLTAAHEVTGSQYASLALLDNGTAVTSGLGKTGQIGNGSLKTVNAPTAVDSVRGASGVGGVGGTFYALIGPSQKLAVSLAGAGTGTVGTRGLLCPLSCAASYPQGQVEILRPEGTPGAGFAGFSGDCSGTGVCRVQLNGDVSVTATFGPAAGTKITKAKIGAKKKTATFTFEAPGAITGYQCKLIAPAKKKKRHGKKASASKKKGKAKKPQFKTCTSGKPFRHLKPGTYKFEVRALDSLGPDAKPAVKKFRLKKPRRPKH